MHRRRFILAAGGSALAGTTWPATARAAATPARSVPLGTSPWDAQEATREWTATYMRVLVTC
jgi:hypothetical protein